MNADLAALVLAALGIALSPAPFLLAVALLGASKSARTATAFVTGEALALGAVTASAVFLARAEEGSEDDLGSSLAAVEIAVGAILALLLLVHARRSRERRSPEWWSRLGRVGVRGAFGGGLAMVVVNPKNFALALGGATAILELWSSTGAQAASVVAFTAVAVSLLLALIVLATIFPERAEMLFDRAQGFVLDHERGLVAVLLGTLAVFFLARGVAGSVA